jgi:hypothetical protein
MPFPLVRVLRQMNADEFIHWPHPVKMRFNIIMPLYPFLPSGLLPSHTQNADEFIHWPHPVDLGCVLILLCLCTPFSQVVSFLHMFISKFVCVSHVDHMCISCRPRVLTCRTRLILPGLITAFIEYGEQVVLLSTLMYFPVSFSHKYNMKEDFQYRNCSVIRNHYMCKVSLRTHFDK